jgi:hypothetical protein
MSRRAHNYDVWIRWKNFRGFEDTGPINLRPLTVLIGPNNAGKSSVFMPLLLLSQTMASRDPVTTLITKGPLINAGEFESLVAGHDPGKTVSFELKYHIHAPSKDLKKVGRYQPGGLEIQLRKDLPSDSIKLIGYSIVDIFDRSYLSGAIGPNGLDITLHAESDTKMTPAELKAIRDSQPVNFLYTPTDAIVRLNDQASRPPDEEKKPAERFSTDFTEYLSATGSNFGAVRDILYDLSYVGPVRERLHRYYEVQGSRPYSVGPLGKFAPEIFRRMNASQRNEVGAWIRKFNIGKRLTVKLLGDEMFSLLLAQRRGTKDTYQNVADSGFGLSQVLPLIIQAVATKERRQVTDDAALPSFTIAEQPEIHLNPGLQATLADLFADMASQSQRVLVETHSEHLVLRLRRLIADGTIDASDVGLHFVELKGGTSTIRAIPIDRYGAISGEDWPEGFFGDPLRESLALAQAQVVARKKP